MFHRDGFNRDPKLSLIKISFFGAIFEEKKEKKSRFLMFVSKTFLSQLGGIFGIGFKVSIQMSTTADGEINLGRHKERRERKRER